MIRDGQGDNNRLAVEALFCIARVGAPWRDFLPESFGNGNSVFQRFHRKAVKGVENQAIGRSRGGLATNILALVDVLANLARFILTPSQQVGAEPLLDGVDIRALIADKANDDQVLRQKLEKRGALAVTAPKSDRSRPIPAISSYTSDGI